MAWKNVAPCLKKKKKYFIIPGHGSDPSNRDKLFFIAFQLLPRFNVFRRWCVEVEHRGRQRARPDGLPAGASKRNLCSWTVLNPGHNPGSSAEINTFGSEGKQPWEQIVPVTRAASLCECCAR